MPPASTDPADRPPVRIQVRPRTPDRLGRHVSRVADDLQRRYIDRRPEAIATLAKLRHAVNAEPGVADLPSAIWLSDSLIGHLAEGRRPISAERAVDRAERALHTAVTLFAVHQQSQRDQKMHTPGTTFATAVQWLAAVSTNDETVHRRFAAVGTAIDYGELVYHARGLVTQLRGAKIGFDYGVFADDLYLFQHEGAFANGLNGPERVRSQWGREYWRAKPDPKRPAAPDDLSTSQE